MTPEIFTMLGVAVTILIASAEGLVEGLRTAIARNAA